MKWRANSANAPLSVNHMKRLVVDWLIAAMCLALCAGCSSLEPSQKQRAALANSPWAEKCLLPSDQNPSEAGIDTWPESVFNQ